MSVLAVRSTSLSLLSPTSVKVEDTTTTMDAGSGGGVEPPKESISSNLGTNINTVA